MKKSPMWASLIRAAKGEASRSEARGIVLRTTPPTRLRRATSPCTGEALGEVRLPCGEVHSTSGGHVNETIQEKAPLCKGGCLREQAGGLFFLLQPLRLAYGEPPPLTQGRL